MVDDDASISEEEEEDEVFDESDDDDKPKPKKRRVIADDSDEEMAVKASPSWSPCPRTRKETRPGTPTPFDARGFHDRYRKRSAPVSADKRESRRSRRDK